MKKPLYMMYNIVLLIICLIGGLYGVASAQPASHTLTVEKSGGGNGTVTSSPAGIKCGGQCFYDFGEGRNVNLTAKADAGSKFISWSGACSGTKGCSVAVSTDITATALFTSESNINISPVSKEFGNVWPGKTKSSRFKVANKGSMELNITAITLTGADAGLFLLKTNTCLAKPIKPGASCAVTAAYAPDLNTAGLKTATMTIASNDPDTPAVDVVLSARTTAMISVSPAFKNFGVVATGKPKSSVFKVFNKGTVEMDLTSITFDGLNTDEFSKTADTCSITNKINPSKSCAITVTFTPKSEGLKTAQLNIKSDDPDTKTLAVALVGGATGQVPTKAWEPLGAFGSNFGVWSEIIVDGAGNPTLAYTDAADSHLYAKSYSKGSWNVLQGSISTGIAGYISLTVDDAGVLLAGYQDYAAGSKATVKSYSGGSWSVVGAAGFSNSLARGVAISSKNGTPYLAFLDYDAGEDRDRITVKWDKGNGGWVDFGSPRFSGTITQGVALTIPSNGKPCVAAYEFDNVSRYLYVYQYDNPMGTGGLWTKIGTGGADPWIVDDTGVLDVHLVNDNAGGLYVSYTTQVGPEPRVVVKKFNPVADTWDVLSGSDGYVDDGSALWNTLFCDGKDLYVAYLDDSDTNSYKLVLKKYDRPSRKWVLYAGKLPFSLTPNEFPSGFSVYGKNGVLYVATIMYNSVALNSTANITRLR
jgi:hypothetical protein